uniref:Uncharacterized protein n=1 Tax=Trichogramma kaykai TaxID=54128 RepID=A0ABD2X0F6_9HYME
MYINDKAKARAYYTACCSTVACEPTIFRRYRSILREFHLARRCIPSRAPSAFEIPPRVGCSGFAKAPRVYPASYESPPPHDDLQACDQRVTEKAQLRIFYMI